METAEVKEALKLHNLTISVVRKSATRWEIVEISLSSKTVRITSFSSREACKKDFMKRKKIIKNRR